MNSTQSGSALPHLSLAQATSQLAGDEASVFVSLYAITEYKGTGRMESAIHSKVFCNWYGGEDEVKTAWMQANRAQHNQTMPSALETYRQVLESMGYSHALNAKWFLVTENDRSRLAEQSGHQFRNKLPVQFLNQVAEVGYTTY